MKVAIVDIRDILDEKKNPTLCLSPLRYTGDCIRCESFKRALRNNNYDIDLFQSLLLWNFLQLEEKE